MPIARKLKVCSLTVYYYCLGGGIFCYDELQGVTFLRLLFFTEVNKEGYYYVDD